jgi:tetratricopeptide (TPR) repeat protein
MARGVSLFYREQEHDAVEYLRSALQQQPADLRARYLICLAAQLHSDEETIEDMSRAARKLDPRNAYALACAGVWFMDLANFARADQYFEQALLRIPNDVDLWFGRGMLYDYWGEREKAIGAYLRVVTLDSNNVSGRISLGNAYAASGDYDAAFEQYAKARELAPDSENPHSRLGRDLFYAGALGSALPEFRAAINEEPDTPVPYFFLLAGLRQTGKADEILEIYEEIRRRFSDRPQHTGPLFEQIGAWDDALRDYRRALEEQPDDARLHYRLASCLRDTRRWEEAIPEYRHVARLAPTHRSVHEELAGALLRTGQYEEAITVARQAIALDACNFSAYSTLADALFVLGKAGQATTVLEQQERLQQQARDRYQAKYFGADDDSPGCD